MLDGRRLALGELFKVTMGDAEHLVISADACVLDYLGADLTDGRMTVEGVAGHYAGQGMRGGTIVLRGGAGDFAACGMQGGLLRIDGRVGDGWGGPHRRAHRHVRWRCCRVRQCRRARRRPTCAVA